MCAAKVLSLGDDSLAFLGGGMGESYLLAEWCDFSNLFFGGWEFLLIFWYQQVTKTCKLFFVLFSGVNSER